MNETGITRARGYALLMVLITVGLVAILLGQMESGASTEARIAAGLRNRAQAQAAADGAIWNATYHVLPGDGAWAADAAVHQLQLGGAQVDVAVEDLADRLDLNRDPASAVALILRSQGVDRARADEISQKIIDWRTGNPRKQTLGAKQDDYVAAGLPYGPPNEDYENLAETELVLGMTPDIAAKLAPYVTIYSWGLPRLAAARTPLQTEALKLALAAQPAEPNDQPAEFFYAVTARAQVGDATARRNAVLLMDLNAGNGGRFWRLVEWD